MICSFGFENFSNEYTFVGVGYNSSVGDYETKLKKLEEFLISLNCDERENYLNLLFSEQEVNVKLALSIADSTLTPTNINDLLGCYQIAIREKTKSIV